MSRQRSLLSVTEYDEDIGSPSLQPETPDERPITFSRLFHFASGVDKTWMVIGTIGALVQGTTAPLLAVHMQELFRCTFVPNDDGTFPPQQGPHHNRNVQVADACGTLLILGGVAFASGACQSFGWERSAENQNISIRSKVFRKLLRKDIFWFDDRSVGEIVTRISKNSSDLREGMGSPIGNLCKNICTVILGFAVAFWIDWRMALAMSSAVPLMAASVLCLISVHAKFSKLVQEQFAQAGGTAEATLSAIRTVVAYGGQESAVQKYDEKLAEVEKVGGRMAFAQGLSFGVVLMVIYVAIAVGFWVGAHLVTASYERGCWKNTPQPFGDCFTGATMVAILQSVVNGGIALASVGPAISSITAARAAASFLLPIIFETSPVIGEDKLATVSGKIEFSRVHFAYPSRPDDPILSKLSLVVPAGSTVALVGVSGSGKSTILQLIMRYYRADGNVTFDGHNILSLNLDWLRSQMALVQQEPVIFSSSIKENIIQGRLEANSEDVIAAAITANAHGFISSFPQAYSTALGGGGNQLSGGQKQRIAIARAVIRNPSILLLDEATSALDNESERVVQDALDALIKSRSMTTIIIAHRLSTIQNADKICVFGKGFLADEGTHEELVLRPGLYADLVSLQTVVGDGKSTRELLRSVTSGLPDEPCVKRCPLAFRSHTTPALTASTQQVGNFRRAQSTRIMARRMTFAPHNTVSSRKSRSGMKLKTISLGIGLPSHVSFFQSPDVDPSDSEEEFLTPRSSLSSCGTAPAASFPEIAVPLHRRSSGMIRAATDEHAPVSIKQMWMLSQKDFAWIAAAVAATLMMSASMPMLGQIYAGATNYLTKPPAKRVRPGAQWVPDYDSSDILNKAAGYAIEFAALGILMVPLSLFQAWGYRKASESLTRQLQRRTFEAMTKQEMNWFDVNGTGMLLERLSTDVPMMKVFTIEALQSILQSTFTLAGGFTLALLASWRLSLFCIALLPVLTFGHALALRGSAKKHENVTSALVTEAVTNIRTIAAFGLEDVTLEKYHQLLITEFRKDRRLSTISSFASAYTSASPFIFYALIVFTGSCFVNAGKMSPSGVMGVLFPIMFSAGGLNQAQTWFSQKAKANGAGGRVFGILSRAVRMDSLQNGPQLQQHCKGRIEFSHVDFWYSMRPSSPIFMDLCLTIPSGTSVAFVGPSGCGKSTTVSLLLRFYEPRSGRIVLDGENIQDLDVRYLRNQMALVQQEPVLFDCSISDNIAYGCGAATVEDIKAAAISSNAHDFIISFPGGYTTRVGARGSQLSGGQRQRIAIARAIVRDPCILLLDEATSALDVESERVVQESLDKLMNGSSSMTSIAIAHRLATVQKCDVIFVLDEGRVAERGTHSELLKTGGIYSALVSKQVHDGQ